MLGCLPHETTRSVPAQQGFIGAGTKDKKDRIKEMLAPVKSAPLALKLYMMLGNY